jgi:hypothetical protein
MAACINPSGQLMGAVLGTERDALGTECLVLGAACYVRGARHKVAALSNRPPPANTRQRWTLC